MDGGATPHGFGPLGARAVTERPPAAGDTFGKQTWFKDASVAGAKDGTVLDASWLNHIVGNLARLAILAGIPLTNRQDTDDILYEAVREIASKQLFNSKTLGGLADVIDDDSLAGMALVRAADGWRAKYLGIGEISGMSDDVRALLARATIAEMQALLGLGNYALLASPAFSGNPTAPTQSTADSSERLATTALVDNKIAAALPGGIPAHGHDAADILTGTIADARLPTRLMQTALLVTDLNTATSSGWYRNAASATNAPTTAEGYFTVTRTSGTQILQLWVNHSTTSRSMYSRVMNGGVWSSWADLGGGSGLGLTEGSVADFRSRAVDKILTPECVWDAGAVVTLTDAATIAVDMATFINAEVTLGGNRTLGNPTNPKVGQAGTIYIVQDGTGGRTLAYGSNWKFVGGVAPTVFATAGRVSPLHYKVRTATFIEAALREDVR